MASDSQPPVQDDDLYCTDVEKFLGILHPDGVFEVRVIDCPDRKGGSYVSTASGYFNDPALAAKAIMQVDTLEPPSVYVSVNPVANALLARAANRIVHRAKKTTAKPDVLRRRWLFVDIDAKRQSGISSTDAELAAAMELSERLLGAMRAEGWPEPLRGMSGNGSYLFWRVDLPNDAGSEALTQRVLMAMAQRFDSDGAVVDVSPFDANRICKVLGTVARKGDAVVGIAGEPDRPHRRSWFIEPDGALEVLAIEQLVALADSFVDPESVRVPVVSGPVAGGVARSIDVIDRARKYVAKMDPSVQGELGHQRLYAAACRVVHDFGLADADALSVLCDSFNPRCSPVWEMKSIERAIAKAKAKGKPDPGFGSNGHDDVDLSGLLASSKVLVDEPTLESAKSTSVTANDVIEMRCDADWDDPIPIDRPDLPPFPVHRIPSPLREWVMATAEATQTPVDLAGLLALAVCAGAVARRVEIEAGRGYVEPLNLYVAVLLDPANRKSAVFRLATAPLRAIEAELIEAAGPEIARALSDRRMREATLKKAETKAAAGDHVARAEALALAEELATEPLPSMPRLLVDDATAEAVEMALAAQGGRLVVAGAEGGLFDVMGGRYAGGAANLDCFLKGHAGDDLRVDRVSRGTLIVDRVCLTLAYSVQPEVLRGMARQRAFRGRGLIGRFWYAMPASPLGSRRIDPEPVRDDVAMRYESVVRRLAAIPERFDGPGVLVLSPAATTMFKAWAAEVEEMLGDDGRLASMRDWGGKLVGLTARLAGVLHLVGAADVVDPVAVPISVEVIESAIELARWAVPHAEAAIGLMAADDGSMDDATYVLRWLRQRREPEVSRRDVHSHGRARFDGDPGRLDRALGVLVDRGWLRPIDDGRAGPGRPSIRYRCHPSVMAETSVAKPDRAVVPPWESIGDEPQLPERVSGVIEW